MKKGFLLSLVFLLLAFQIQAVSNIKVGADRFDKLLPLINNKRVALVVNHTSCLSNGTHLLDALISESVNVTKILINQPIK